MYLWYQLQGKSKTRVHPNVRKIKILWQIMYFLGKRVSIYKFLIIILYMKYLFPASVIKPKFPFCQRLLASDQYSVFTEFSSTCILMCVHKYFSPILQATCWFFWLLHPTPTTKHYLSSVSTPPQYLPPTFPLRSPSASSGTDHCSSRGRIHWEAPEWKFSFMEESAGMKMFQWLNSSHKNALSSTA